MSVFYVLGMRLNNLFFFFCGVFTNSSGILPLSVKVHFVVLGKKSLSEIIPKQTK